MGDRLSCGPERARQRVMHIVDAHGSISAKDLCAEMIRRGWAYPDLTPEDIGLNDNAIVRRRLHD